MHGPPDQEANDTDSPANVEESANTSSNRGTGCAAAAQAGTGTAESLWSVPAYPIGCSRYQRESGDRSFAPA